MELSRLGQTLLVSNTGGANLTVGSISITGAGRADYQETGTYVAGHATDRLKLVAFRATDTREYGKWRERRRKFTFRRPICLLPRAAAAPIVRVGCPADAPEH